MNSDSVATFHKQAAMPNVAVGSMAMSNQHQFHRACRSCKLQCVRHRQQRLPVAHQHRLTVPRRLSMPKQEQHRAQRNTRTALTHDLPSASSSAIGTQ